MTNTDIFIDVAPQRGTKPQRLVIATLRSGGECRDNFDPNSARSREKFIGMVAAKMQVAVADLAWLENEITSQADAADRAADDAAGDLLAGDGQRKSQATQLVELAIAADAELFHDGNGDAFCSMPVGSHREVRAVLVVCLR